MKILIIAAFVTATAFGTGICKTKLVLAGEPSSIEVTLIVPPTSVSVALDGVAHLRHIKIIEMDGRTSIELPTEIKMSTKAYLAVKKEILRVYDLSDKKTVYKVDFQDRKTTEWQTLPNLDISNVTRDIQGNITFIFNHYLLATNARLRTNERHPHKNKIEVPSLDDSKPIFSPIRDARKKMTDDIKTAIRNP